MSTPSSATPSAHAAITTTLTTLGSAHDTKLQQRAADLHANAAAIAKQEKELAKQTAALAKESKKWQSQADKATKRLNEVGDVQNWAECIERELLVLEETLKLVEGRGQGDGGV